jgi:hypothetical protein
MPLYHFSINDGSSPDPSGTELESLAVAKCEAVKMAGNIICEAAAAFWDRAEWNMTVTNHDRLTLFTLHFLGIDAPSVRATMPV